MTVSIPDVAGIRANRARLGDRIVTTPVRHLVDDAVARAVGATTEVWLKEELFQRTGSFKPRGALSAKTRPEPLDEARERLTACLARLRPAA